MDERDAIFFNCCSLGSFLTLLVYFMRVMGKIIARCLGLRWIFQLHLIGFYGVWCSHCVIVFEIGVCIVIYVDFCAWPRGGDGGRAFGSSAPQLGPTA